MHDILNHESVEEVAPTDLYQKHLEQLAALMDKYRAALRYYDDLRDPLDQIEGVYRRLERIALNKQRDMDKLREHVLENLLGIRVLVNLILNGDWTHAQKNNTIWALGELIETAIKRLREEHFDFGQRFDPFTPEWSRQSQYQKRIEAENECKNLREQVAKLTAELADRTSEESDYSG
jgi:hypothetical protein